MGIDTGRAVFWDRKGGILCAILRSVFFFWNSPSGMLGKGEKRASCVTQR